MGLDDLVNKGKELFEQNKDKVEGALKSDQAEEISDKVIDGVAGAAKKVLPENLHDKVDSARDAADGAIGNEK
ncbi:Rv0909 family putative TA system antitoxin [Microbacterium marinilacus]|uniref:MT0933-like antitoxin protein n=1 Tax=Microbacterium marinilacus TaxID=415209 RepID=A0ABP7BBI3_9MICO|nr:Rv0909 family putative TA system antitoxin [Microbacterium marinilacus]MBY0689486.1 antitoxin [Microbacterium marinilacus]